MTTHCDGCGRTLDPGRALLRLWEGVLYFFCGEACARAGVHLEGGGGSDAAMVEATDERLR